jgi:hypothetical protein
MCHHVMDPLFFFSSKVSFGCFNFKDLKFVWFVLTGLVPWRQKWSHGEFVLGERGLQGHVEALALNRYPSMYD